MRWKFDRDNYEEYKCCFCLHVRTGTLILGLLHLIGCSILIFMLVGAYVHPTWLQIVMPNSVLDPTATNTHPLPNKNNGTLQFGKYRTELIYDNVMLGLILSVISLSITILLLYGTILGRAKHITPFFCIQVFDLCLSGMTMLGYFSDIPDLKKYITSMTWLPMKERILMMDNDQLTLLSLIVFVSFLSIKMYLIGIVWGCYKYLRQRELMEMHTRIRTYNIEASQLPEDAEMLLPPKYEDVLLMAQNEVPPPAYASED